MAQAAAAAGDAEAEKNAHVQALELAGSISELPQDGLWLERLSNIYAHVKQFDRSVVLMEKAIACQRSLNPPQHPHIADRLMTYSRVLQHDNRLQESKQAFMEAQAIYKVSLPEDDIRLRSALP